MRTSFPQALLVSAVLCCAFWSKGVEGCHTLQIFSQHFTTQTFERLPIDRYPSSTGRPSYVSVPENAEDHPVYLYHAVHEESGIGQWIINDVWNDPEHALSFINSWSILPHLITSVHDSPSTFVSWQYGLPQGGWESDRTVAIRCMDELDTTVFLDSSVQLAPLLTGFYVEQHVSEDYADIYDGPVYSQISRYVQRPEEEVFMFIIHADDEEKKYRWMIGHEIGVDAGIAFISDAPRQAYLIPHEAQWHFSTVDSEHPWLIDLSAKLYSQALYYQTHEIPAHGPRDIFRVMHYIRSATVSDNNAVIELRNKIPMPKIGLGTGGLFHEESPRVFREAIDAGYRLFDMAREYGNEHIMGNLLQDLLNEKNPIQRKDLFLETKVWPTELGFLPTSQAIDASLNEYHTNYIDLYMLHWPE